MADPADPIDNLLKELEVCAGRASAGCELFTNLVQSIGKGELSFRQAHTLAVAARQSGASSGKLDMMAAASKGGELGSNLERDIYRLICNILHIPDLLYPLEVPVNRPGKRAKPGDDGEPLTQKTGMLCPHEVAALIYEKDPAKFHDCFGTLKSNKKYWAHHLELGTSWLMEHPALCSVQASPESIMAVALFGDDIGI